MLNKLKLFLVPPNFSKKFEIRCEDFIEESIKELPYAFWHNIRLRHNAIAIKRVDKTIDKNVMPFRFIYYSSIDKMILVGVLKVRKKN